MFFMNHRRTRTGQMFMSLGLVVLLFFIVICGATIDGARLIVARNELQRAVDAASLAGAYCLYDSESDPELAALAVAAGNYVEGVPVGNSEGQSELNVEVNLPSEQNPGQVSVYAKREIAHTLLRFIGRKSDLVSARSTAGIRGPVRQVPANLVFPLVVSWSCEPKIDLNPGKSISSLSYGDTFFMSAGSEQYSNAAFSALGAGTDNANLLHEYVDLVLGQSTGSNLSIPPLRVGDNVSMTNGIAGMKYLCRSPYRELLLARDFVVIPVVDAQAPLSGDARICGFVAVKILDIDANGGGGNVLTLQGRVVMAAIPTPEGVVGDSELADRLAVKSIRLLE